MNIRYTIDNNLVNVVHLVVEFLLESTLIKHMV